MKQREGLRLVLYDGVCALCNGVVRWLLKHDPHGRFSFLALQHLNRLPQSVPPPPLNESMRTLWYWDGHAWHQRSGAVLRMCWLLPWPWKACSAGLLVPAFLRDSVYSVVARFRYRWFGRFAHCPLPPEGSAHRFL